MIQCFEWKLLNSCGALSRLNTFRLKRFSWLLGDWLRLLQPLQLSILAQTTTWSVLPIEWVPFGCSNQKCTPLDSMEDNEIRLTESVEWQTPERGSQKKTPKNFKAVKIVRWRNCELITKFEFAFCRSLSSQANDDKLPLDYKWKMGIGDS